MISTREFEDKYPVTSEFWWFTPNLNVRHCIVDEYRQTRRTLWVIVSYRSNWRRKWKQTKMRVENIMHNAYDTREAAEAKLPAPGEYWSYAHLHPFI